LAQRDKLIEDAIREYRFVYQSGTEMQPLSWMPRLSDFPPELGRMFLQAFGRGTRPSAQEWLSPLKNLANYLKRCSTNDSHHFYQAAPSCPWCRAELASGRTMFGIKLAAIGNGAFNLEIVWARIESVQPAGENRKPAERNVYLGQVQPDAAIPALCVRVRGAKRRVAETEKRVAEAKTLAVKVERRGRAERIWGLGTMLAGVGIAALQLIPLWASACVVMVGTAVMVVLWRLGGRRAAERDSARVAAQAAEATAIKKHTATAAAYRAALTEHAAAQSAAQTAHARAVAGQDVDMKHWRSLPDSPVGFQRKEKRAVPRKTGVSRSASDSGAGAGGTERGAKAKTADPVSGAVSH
jgi:hypothetical protein